MSNLLVYQIIMVISEKSGTGTGIGTGVGTGIGTGVKWEREWVWNLV